MILHNNILMEFLDDYAKSVYGRQLVNKIDMSQKSISLELNRLEAENLLKSKKLGNIKNFYLNIKNPIVKNLIITAEISKKNEFLKDNPFIPLIFKQDSRIVGVFGSYANNSNDKESDLDVFIIGSKRKEDYNLLGESFDLNISIKYFSEKDFIKLMKTNPLIKEIIRNHIILFNVESFVEMIWGDYYGFD